MAAASSGVAAQKEKGDWSGKHRNVARKLVLEGGWVQKKTLRHWLVG